MEGHPTFPYLKDKQWVCNKTMKIIILGAGQVGSSLAANLASEANDIVIVDKNQETLLDLQDRLDLETLCGHASYRRTRC